MTTPLVSTDTRTIRWDLKRKVPDVTDRVRWLPQGANEVMAVVPVPRFSGCDVILERGQHREDGGRGFLCLGLDARSW